MQSHGVKESVAVAQADVFNREGRTSPQQGRDFWHKNFVKLPSSNSNFMMTKRIGMVCLMLLTKHIKSRKVVCISVGQFSSSFDQTKQTLRWDVISKRLRDVASKKTVTVDDVKVHQRYILKHYILKCVC